MKMFDDIIITAQNIETLQVALVTIGQASFAEINDDAGIIKGDFICGNSMLPIRTIWNDDAIFDDNGEEITPPTQRFAAYTCLRLPVGTDLPIVNDVIVASWEPGLPGWGDNPEINYNNQSEFIPLNKFQFSAMLRILEIEPITIENAIDYVIKDKVENAIAKARFYEAESYNRNHPLFSLLGKSLGLTELEINEAWKIAQNLK